MFCPAVDDRLKPALILRNRFLAKKVRKVELKDLVRKAQNGDDAAFNEICRRFEGLVRHQAFKAHLRVLGEDALAEAWLAVTEAVKSYDESSGVYFAGYVESKVKFALWNLFKRERRRCQHELPASEGEENDSSGSFRLDLVAGNENIEQELERAELGEHIKTAVRSLPERQRQALVMTIFAENRLAEVGQQMGITVQAVHNLRCRALTRLKKELTGMYVSERG